MAATPDAPQAAVQAHPITRQMLSEMTLAFEGCARHADVARSLQTFWSKLDEGTGEVRDWPWSVHLKP